MDIVEAVRKHVALTSSGHNYTGLCPFHLEQTPSLTVDPKHGTFHCFGCGLRGNASQFVALIAREQKTKQDEDDSGYGHAI